MTALQCIYSETASLWTNVDDNWETRGRSLHHLPAYSLFSLGSGVDLLHRASQLDFDFVPAFIQLSLFWDALHTLLNWLTCHYCTTSSFLLCLRKINTSHIVSTFLITLVYMGQPFMHIHDCSKGCANSLFSSHCSKSPVTKNIVCSANPLYCSTTPQWKR